MTDQTGHFTANMADAASKITSETWPAASTFTSLALAQARAEMLYTREGATKVTVVVTDGIPINPGATTKSARKLKNDKVRVIWVPVTPGAPKEQLEEWASYPKDQNV